MPKPYATYGDNFPLGQLMANVRSLFLRIHFVIVSQMAINDHDKEEEHGRWSLLFRSNLSLLSGKSTPATSGFLA